MPLLTAEPNQQVEKPDPMATRIDGRPVGWAEWRRLVAAAGDQSVCADWPALPLP